MNKRPIGLLSAALVLFGTPAPALAQTSIEVNGDGSAPVQLLVMFSLLAVLPGIVFAVTCFPRIIIVLSFLRQAMGTQQTPPNQILIGIALFLTVFVMAPTFNDIKKDAVDPYNDKKITLTQALERGQEPLRTFMFKQVGNEELGLFVRLSKMDQPKTRADVPTYVLVPAFMLSELKRAFAIGFMVFLPFLIIDLVVASTLLSVGMMMLPPPVVSLPFKVILFVLVDGWSLTVEGLVNSFAT